MSPGLPRSPIRWCASGMAVAIVFLGGCAQPSTGVGRPTETPTMGIRRLPITGSLTIEGGPLDGQHEVVPHRGEHQDHPGWCSTTDLGHGRELEILGHLSVEDSPVHFRFFAPYGSGEDLRAREFVLWGGHGEFKGEATLAIDVGPETPRGGREHLTIQLDAEAGPLRITGRLDCVDDGAYPDPAPSPSPRDGRSPSPPDA